MVAALYSASGLWNHAGRAYKADPTAMMPNEMPDSTEERPQTADRGSLRGLFEAAVAAAHPAQALPPVLPPPPAAGRILLLSTGKAGGSMMSAAVRHYRETCGLPPERLFGVGIDHSNQLIEVRCTPSLLL